MQRSLGWPPRLFPCNRAAPASPRAALALYKTAQANAAIGGRDFVAPDDVKKLSTSVLSHRMLLTSNARLRGRTTAQVVADVLDTIPVPIER